MHRIAQIRFATHNVHIDFNSDQGRINCFKHNDHRCDFAVFDCEQDDEAAEWCILALPQGHWEFQEDPET